MPNTLFLRFEAPLQSWGERGQWSERDTAPEPTKSGITGLLACALGWQDDKRISSLSRQIRLAVRCDQPGTYSPLVDFHTVGGGYLESSPQLLTAEGKPKKGHTELTYRYYLCDASFLVAIQAEQEVIAQLAHAVQYPHWPIYLGRKCCVPTRPVYDDVGNYPALEEALYNHPARIYPKGKKSPASLRVRAVLEALPLEVGSIRRRTLLTSRTWRLFEPNYTVEKWLDNIPTEYLNEEP